MKQRMSAGLRRELHNLIDVTRVKIGAAKPAALLKAVIAAVQDDRIVSRQIPPLEIRQTVKQAMESHARRQQRIDSLNDMQQAFVLALAGPASGNATRAAQLAGYAPDNYASARTIGWRLLTKANVLEAVAQAQARQRAASDWAFNRIVELASSSMANVTSVDENGNLQVNLKKAQAAAAMGQLKKCEREVLSKHKDGRDKVVVWTIEMHDPFPALYLLAKMYGLIGRNKGRFASVDFFADSAAA